MGYLATEKAPEKWSAAYFKLFVERLRTAVNNIDASNFPDGINGGMIKDRTVTTGALVNFAYEQTFFAQTTPYTTTSTTSVQAGPLVQWNPSTWGQGKVKMILEVMGASANASATATFELVGADGLLQTITTTSTAFQSLRSQAFSPPENAQTLAIKVKTSNASYSAQALSAKLIIVPAV